MSGVTCPVLSCALLAFDEYQRVSVESDQVYLAVARAHVAPHDREPQATKVLGGEVLAMGAQRAAPVTTWQETFGGRVGGAHASERTSRDVT
jgi:hypothetical protein